MKTYHSALYAGRGISSVGRLQALNREGEEALLSDRIHSKLMDLESLIGHLLRVGRYFSPIDYDVSLTRTDPSMIVWHHL
jgi:hypothetical protein